MKKKIVFILNTVQDPRCYKRINEFRQNGYEVSAYGFSRETSTCVNFDHINIEILGCYSNTLSYFKRSFKIISSLYGLFNKYRGADVIYYYLGLDIAFFSLIIAPRNCFIYEEADLTYTYMKNSLIRKCFKKIDEFAIKRSIHTVFTSEGFVQYHFRKISPKNISVIPNRLNEKILSLKILPKNPINIDKIKFAFVGAVRFRSVYNFARMLLKYFPHHEIHFYGYIMDNVRKQYDELKAFPNIFFHGSFKNPDDLPLIYSEIDMVLATYDSEFENVKYAEPNKVYESIYFETPIIVTQGTFLAEKVNSLNIGYAIDPLDDQALVKFIRSLSALDIEQKIRACQLIGKKYCVSVNKDFFLKIKEIVNN
ncbi:MULTISPECIES: glycosyltransferase [unclassified Butyricimonas]|uniref:glycosyltransferase n=1 Tax=unclassified Butyricimonas TaxID=2637652 RepID=UPI000B37E2E9|nr:MULTISPECIES: glycosyltransferase [unclassified Butyricimonas]OUN66823.1 hypothetical protein B5G13_00860 [Butyricimonas sp. An62]